jgi:hypothetical protein
VVFKHILPPEAAQIVAYPAPASPRIKACSLNWMAPAAVDPDAHLMCVANNGRCGAGRRMQLRIGVRSPHSGQQFSRSVESPAMQACEPA